MMFKRSSFFLLLFLVPVLAGAQNGEPSSKCEISFVQSREPLNVASFFAWYHSPEEFECMSSRPLEGWFVSSDMRRTRQHFRRLRSHGFNAIMPVIYADPRNRGGGAGDMRQLLKALAVAQQQKLQFIPLFDLAVAAGLQEGFCNPFAGICEPGTTPIEEYNFDRHPELEALTVEMLTMIAREFILPFTHSKRLKRSTARFLTDENDELILDEYGLPRPEIYLYIARAWADNSGGYRTIKTTVRKITKAYRKLGLGKPAFTLDVIQGSDKTYNDRLVAAFGDTVVGITSFFEPNPVATTMGELARDVHAPMFLRSASQLGKAIARGAVPPRTQVSAGTAANFDKRKWAECNGGFGNVAWPAMGPEDVFEKACSRLTDDSGNYPAPYRNKRYIYAGEGFEATWLCAETENGRFVYPNKYGCQPLHIFEILLKEIGER
jgi:hypothetical protein